VDSELERLRLDLKKNQSDMKKKDILISEMREHVLEVKTMLKKLADKCRSLEYVNETQHCDLLDAQSEISRLEDELSAAVELKNECKR
jgi:ABC-type phosphate transport system auxiliary subunit